MTNRRLLRWSLILLILAAFAVWLEPTRVVWGWLRGEAFYQGRSTSYWALQIEPWDSYCCVGGSGGLWSWTWIYQYAPKTDAAHRWFSRYVNLPEPAWPAVLDGDPEAASVLHELLEHPSQLVRQWAKVGAERINTDRKGPVIFVQDRMENGDRSPLPKRDLPGEKIGLLGP
jgi:hypothetical protein